MYFMKKKCIKDLSRYIIKILTIYVQSDIKRQGVGTFVDIWVLLYAQTGVDTTVFWLQRCDGQKTFEPLDVVLRHHSVLSSIVII